MTKLTKEQATIITAYTGYLILDPKSYRNALEDKLNTIVEIKDLTNPTFQRKLQEIYKEEFLALAP
jgi:hypothetical protein